MRPLVSVLICIAVLASVQARSLLCDGEPDHAALCTSELDIGRGGTGLFEHCAKAMWVGSDKEPAIDDYIRAFCHRAHARGREDIWTECNEKGFARKFVIPSWCDLVDLIEQTRGDAFLQSVLRSRPLLNGTEDSRPTFVRELSHIDEEEDERWSSLCANYWHLVADFRSLRTHETWCKSAKWVGTPKKPVLEDYLRAYCYLSQFDKSDERRVACQSRNYCVMFMIPNGFDLIDEINRTGAEPFLARALISARPLINDDLFVWPSGLRLNDDSKIECLKKTEPK